MPADQQPEEAASRVPAAAAGFAGSLAQTRIYGRGAQLRGAAAEQAQSGKDATEQGQPETDPAAAGPDAGHETAAMSAAHGEPSAAMQAASLADPPSGGAVDRPPAEVEEPWAETAVGRMTRSLDDPDLEAELLSGAPRGGHTSAAVEDADLSVSSEVVVACSELDSAAAAARLAQGQQLDLPVVVPPAPGIGPGL